MIHLLFIITPLYNKHKNLIMSDFAPIGQCSSDSVPTSGNHYSVHIHEVSFIDSSWMWCDVGHLDFSFKMMSYGFIYLYNWHNFILFLSIIPVCVCMAEREGEGVRNGYRLCAYRHRHRFVCFHSHPHMHCQAVGDLPCHVL